MRSLWMEIKYIKSAARLLDRDWGSQGGLDLSKKVLWISVGQRGAELHAVKFGDKKEILPLGLAQANWAERKNSFLTSNFDSL